MNEVRTVAVTGAAGSVGWFVVEQLLEQGYRVIAIDRPGSALPEPREGVEVRAGDLTDEAFCRASVKGAEAVINTAAVIDIAWSYERLKPINVDAVRWLYEAARAERAAVFVHFSSGSVYDQGDAVIEEDAPIRATSAYEQSKIDSEAVLRSFHGKGGPAYVILRPALIYGPRGRLLGAALAAVPPILRLFTGDKPFAFTGGPRTNWAHAEDVAAAAIFCMENDRCWGEAFNVADDTPLSFGDVLNAANRSYGLEGVGPVVPLPPKWLSRLFYRIIDTDTFFQAINAPAGPLWAMVRSRYGLEDELQVKLDRATASYFVKDVIFGNEKLRAAGFDFKWPDIRTGLPGVVAWYQENNWAPRLDREPDLDVPDTWGFEFHQVLRGSWSPDGSQEKRRVELAVLARTPSVRRYVAERRFALGGTVTLGGLVHDAPLVGSLEAAPLSRGKFVYEFDFRDPEGATYHFRGIEHIEPANIIETMTTLELIVTNEAGATVGRGEARFDLRTELLSMAASFRPIY